MELGKFQHLFESKGINFKYINSSPIGDLARGNTYVFTIQEDSILPKSVGFISQTASELVFLYTCEALSLFRDDSQESHYYEVLYRVNSQSTICVWVFARRTVKFQLYCRATYKNKKDLSPDELWRMMGAINNDYIRGGKRIKEWVTNPESMVRDSEPIREMPHVAALKDILVRYYHAVKIGESNRYEGIQYSYKTRLNTITNVEAMVELLDKFATISCVISSSIYEQTQQSGIINKLSRDQIEKYSQRIVAILNSKEKSNLGAVILSESGQFFYRATLVFSPGNLSHIYDLLNQMLKECARKARHRKIIVNLDTNNIRKKISEVEQLSQISFMESRSFSLSTYEISNDTRGNEIIEVIEKWSKTNLYVKFVTPKKSYKVMQETTVMLNVRDGLSLHVHCILYEILFHYDREEFILLESDPNYVSNKYYLPTFAVQYLSIPAEIVFNWFKHSYKLEESILRTITRANGTQKFINTENGLVRVKVEIEVQDKIELWAICKKLFLRMVTVSIPVVFTPKFYGYVFRPDPPLLESIEEYFPSLSTYKFSSASFSNSLRFLSCLVEQLSWLHQRNYYHLQLSPLAISVSPAEEPILIDMKFCPLMLPPLSSSTNLTATHFFAPEVLVLMQHKLASSTPKSDYYQSIDASADVYSIGVIMHWMLACNTPEKYPALCPDVTEVIRLVVNEEQRPIIPSEFEQDEPILSDLMHSCWAPKSSRPSLDTIISKLNRRYGDAMPSNRPK